MAATRRSQAEMQRKCKQALAGGKVTDPVEKMRLQLLERGCSGIKAIGRYFFKRYVFPLFFFSFCLGVVGFLIPLFWPLCGIRLGFKAKKNLSPSTNVIAHNASKFLATEPGLRGKLDSFNF